MQFITFSERNMLSSFSHSETFQRWQEQHPQAKITTITPVQKTYVEIEYLIGYEEPDQKENL